MAVNYSAKAFFEDDHPRTLFPLDTNRLIITLGESEVKALISRCLDQNDKATSFLPQQRVHAAKPGHHLRRTVKLDPVAEYFIYDLTYRNRDLFSNSSNPKRSHFGYRFLQGKPMTAASSYEGFRKAISKFSREYKFSMSFDISSYFNSIYHHDLVAWLDTAGGSTEDVNGFGQFLREINSGRSVDCLPQGIYPTKMIGNDFLKFIDESHKIKSSQLLRFMDDFYLFSDSEEDILSDFSSIQKMLGEKGLNINPKKTSFGISSHTKLQSDIDKVKVDLLSRRRLVITRGYDDNSVTLTKIFKTPLTEKEISYISSILESDAIEEDDAELILTIMRNHASRVEARIPYILNKFPQLSKNVYIFSSNIADKNLLSSIVLNACKLQNTEEYQLFWLAKMLEDYLMDSKYASEIVSTLMSHPNATPISKAKVLEIPDNRYGLPDLRNVYLKTGEASWLSWSAAIGSRSLKKISRNHLLKYFAKSSPMNNLVHSIVSSI